MDMRFLKTLVQYASFDLSPVLLALRENKDLAPQTCREVSEKNQTLETESNRLCTATLYMACFLWGGKVLALKHF